MGGKNVTSQVSAELEIIWNIRPSAFARINTLAAGSPRALTAWTENSSLNIRSKE